MIKATTQDIDIQIYINFNFKDKSALSIKLKKLIVIEIKIKSILFMSKGEDLAKYKIFYKEYKTYLTKYKKKNHKIIKIKELI